MIPIVFITYRLIVMSVRSVTHNTIFKIRSDEEIMIRVIHIMSVIPVYISVVIGVIPSVVIIYMHTSYTCQSPVVVIDIDTSDTINSSIIVIIDRNMLYLNDCTVVVILYVGIVVIT